MDCIPPHKHQLIAVHPGRPAHHGCRHRIILFHRRLSRPCQVPDSPRNARCNLSLETRRTSISPRRKVQVETLLRHVQRLENVDGNAHVHGSRRIFVRIQSLPSQYRERAGLHCYSGSTSHCSALRGGLRHGTLSAFAWLS